MSADARSGPGRIDGDRIDEDWVEELAEVLVSLLPDAELTSSSWTGVQRIAVSWVDGVGVGEVRSALPGSWWRPTGVLEVATGLELELVRLCSRPRAVAALLRDRAGWSGSEPGWHEEMMPVNGGWGRVNEVLEEGAADLEVWEEIAVTLVLDRIGQSAPTGTLGAVAGVLIEARDVDFGELIRVAQELEDGRDAERVQMSAS